MSTRYQESEKLLDRALESIPLASQTFSKSITAFPKGAAPLFVTKAKGAKIWDVDGNEYIDFVSALCCITLGYQDKISAYEDEKQNQKPWLFKGE